MSLKARGLLAIVIGLSLGISLTLGSSVLAERHPSETDDSLPWEEARLLAEVLERVREDYVEPVDDQRLIEAAIRGMVEDLDPHSAYLDPSAYQDIQISTSGSYSGVGLEVSVEQGQVVVVSPLDEGPAARAGVLAGDVILSVDGMPVDTDNLQDTVDRLRGPAGTRVVLAVRREAPDDPLTFELVRGRVDVHSVRHSMPEPGYGYVRISHFSETTASDLELAVSDLRRAAGGTLSGLVLDLRNNPGGVLEAAVAVSDAFLDDGIIVSAEGRMPDAVFEADASPGDLLEGAPLAVLVNSGSASASEIVAGALQDHGRATVLGSVTFGKGSVQTVMPLSHGRAIKLTTSRYFTPSGRSIHQRGIEPDLRVDAVAGEGGEEDPALARALGVLKSRQVARR
ncbi:MAG: S41 family peptidase [Gammaproteobacteria bacterium]